MSFPVLGQTQPISILNNFVSPQNGDFEVFCKIGAAVIEIHDLSEYYH